MESLKTNAGGVRRIDQKAAQPAVCVAAPVGPVGLRPEPAILGSL
jgi:hypothetical protein